MRDTPGWTHERLGRARLYACVDSRAQHGDLAEFLDEILQGGVDIVQLRDKSVSVADELAALAVVRQRCLEHGALWAVNDRVDIALVAGAPIVHLGQSDMPVEVARHLLGPDVVIGRSTHSVQQAWQAAHDPEIDYFAVGPVWPTPTKPGRPGIGLDVVAAVAEAEWSQHKPWFAIGGVDSETVGDVVGAGASRVVVVRAVTQAASPAQAAQELRTAVAPAAADTAGMSRLDGADIADSALTASAGAVLGGQKNPPESVRAGDAR